MNSGDILISKQRSDVFRLGIPAGLYLTNFKLLDREARYWRVTDDISFFELEDSTSTLWRGITFGAGTWVRVGAGGAIQTSTDNGLNWTTRTSPAGSNNLNSVIWDGTRFIAVGAARWVIHSISGESWSGFQLGASGIWLAIAHDSGSYAIAGRDGTGLRKCISADPTVSGNWTTAADTGRQWWDVKSNGTYFYSQGQTQSAESQRVVRSLLAETSWPIVASGSGDFLFGIYLFSFSGGNVVMAGTLGRIYTSPVADHSIWTLRTSGTSFHLNATFSAGGIVFAVGDGGVCVQSSDHGVNWTAGPSTGTTAALHAHHPASGGASYDIIVGANGTTLGLSLDLTLIAYPTLSDRSDGTNPKGVTATSYAQQPVSLEIEDVATFTLSGLTPEIVNGVFDFDVLRLVSDVFDLAPNADGSDLQRDPGLGTALLLCLFLDARAQPGDEIPDGGSDRRGWWADTLEEGGQPWGSRLWLLDRAKITPRRCSAPGSTSTRPLPPCSRRARCPASRRR
jgi:hypothetical protein